MSSKGIAILFLPLLLAGFLSVILIGFLGSIGNFFATSLSKLTLIGIAILIAFIVYKRTSKRELDNTTIALIIGAVILALFVLGSNNMFGLKSLLP